MKKKFLAALLFIAISVQSTGCTEASRVSYNLSQEADNFNSVRQLTVINCLQGDILFQKGVWVRACVMPARRRAGHRGQRTRQPDYIYEVECEYA